MTNLMSLDSLARGLTVVSAILLACGCGGSKASGAGPVFPHTCPALDTSSVSIGAGRVALGAQSAEVLLGSDPVCPQDGVPQFVVHFRVPVDGGAPVSGDFDGASTDLQLDENFYAGGSSIPTCTTTVSASTGTINVAFSPSDSGFTAAGNLTATFPGSDGGLTLHSSFSASCP